MFVSEKPFTSLDEFFRVNEENHLWSSSEIAARIKKLNSIYHTWDYKIWKFSDDARERNETQSYCYNSIETLRQASLCYIMGFSGASILMSSAAVEMTVRSILLLSEAVEFVELRDTNPPKIEVHTIYGTEDYSEIRGRLERLQKYFQPWTKARGIEHSTYVELRRQDYPIQISEFQQYTERFQAEFSPEQHDRLRAILEEIEKKEIAKILEFNSPT